MNYASFCSEDHIYSTTAAGYKAGFKFQVHYLSEIGVVLRCKKTNKKLSSIQDITMIWRLLKMVLTTGNDHWSKKSTQGTLLLDTL